MKSDADQKTGIRHLEPDSNPQSSDKLKEAHSWIQGNLQISPQDETRLLEYLKLHLHQVEEEKKELQAENVRLEIETSLDPKTRLLNYERFQKNLRKFYSTGTMSGICALALIDVNRFKSINDTFGHKMGDAVIKRLAKILRQETRSAKFVGKGGHRYDLLARQGGDEFLVFLSGLTHPDDAFKITARYCQEFTTIEWAKEYKLWRKGLKNLPDPSQFRGPSLAIGMLILNFAPSKSQATRDLRARRIIESSPSLVDERMYKSKTYEQECGRMRIFSWRMEFRRGRLERIISHTSLSGEGENTRSIPMFEETYDP